MFRPAVSRTLLLRHATTSTTSTAPLNLLLRNQPRLLSTSSASAKRSTFKGTVARWTLAGALIYWYSTSSVFADEPKFQEDLPPAPSETETDRPPSLLPTKPLRPPRSPGDTPGTPGHDGDDATSGAEALEAEAGQEGAFNPETGEINWDCPCLGGMAHGPCGDEFKAAFSCFVFSTEEPKGVDCIEKFKGMQACFQKHPDVYGSELDGDDDDEDEDELDAPPPTTPDDTPLTAPDGTPLAAKSSPSPPSTDPSATTPGPGSATGQTPAATEAKTAPSLAEPSRSARDTPVLQQAHRGDAGEDAPRRKE